MAAPLQIADQPLDPNQPKPASEPLAFDPNTLQVVVHSRDGVVFEGAATAVSSTNKLGAFDILPRHANMVATISEKLVVFPIGGGEKNIPIETGLLRVASNAVLVFLGI